MSTEPAVCAEHLWCAHSARFVLRDLNFTIDRIDALLDLFSLTSIESQSLQSLSTGQKKKVGICSVLLADRQLLLLDEPFSGGLDPAGIAALADGSRLGRPDGARSPLFWA